MINREDFKKKLRRYQTDCPTGDVGDYDEVEEFLKKTEDQRHKLFRIGETLVDESKYHITSDEAVKKIREIMRG